LQKIGGKYLNNLVFMGRLTIFETKGGKVTNMENLMGETNNITFLEVAQFQYCPWCLTSNHYLIEILTARGKSLNNLVSGGRIVIFKTRGGKVTNMANLRGENNNIPFNNPIQNLGFFFLKEG
jgi:uncharacterized protein YjhX (UPF0386 family)